MWPAGHGDWGLCWPWVAVMLKCWGSRKWKHWPYVENISQSFHLNALLPAMQALQIRKLPFTTCSAVAAGAEQFLERQPRTPGSCLSHLHRDTSTEPLCSLTPQGMEESCLPTAEQPHGPVYSHFSSQLDRIQAETWSEERNLSLQQISTHLQLSQQSPHTFSMLSKVFFGVRADLGLHLLFC